MKTISAPQRVQNDIQEHNPAAKPVDNYAPKAGFRAFFASCGKGCVWPSTFAGADVSLARESRRSDP
ncbi:hypothetical protein CW354_10730 [Marinicaulis flavus]|uniref:Uncharacterized protein n=1 Tax=Hyphococcus luteus TaxID=2058213 RepID=A0A2S7K899_9PROT|nr:hypothetical protein CW354_10730 [Marinicaulis flavus]